MAPPGHYRPNNLSNPFNQYPQQPTNHGHYQPQYNAQNFGGQGGFPTAQQNQQVSIFGGGVVPGAQPGGFGAGGLQGAGGTGLASHEAQLRFAHGAALQQRDAAGMPRDAAFGGRIREVFRNNMDAEFAMIRSLADKYPYISMDTEFPGIAARPMGNFSSKTDYHYQCLRTNVDLLKLIQLAITLWSPEGELPPMHLETPLNRHPYTNSLAVCPCTWVFNFKFDVDEDMAPEHSIDMLKRYCVDFEKNATMGIEPRDFGARLVDSGLVLNKTTTWVSFHSGYDFGHLIKAMYPAHMPTDKEKYFDFLKLWFPKIYDIKQLLRVATSKAHARQLSQQGCDAMAAIGSRARVEEIAEVLECSPEGRPHTAGSDAWLTGSLFFALRQKIFDGEIPDELLNQIFGLSGTEQPASAASRAAAMQTPSSNGAALYTSGLTPKSYQSETPNTPGTTHSGISSTPGPHGGQNYNGGIPGGAFANFLYGR